MENRVYSLNHCDSNWRKLSEFSSCSRNFQWGRYFDWEETKERIKEKENQNKTRRETKCLRVFLRRTIEKKKSVWDRVAYRVNENTWPPKDLISFLNGEK